MALSDDAYRQMLSELLPSGPAWPRESDAALMKLLDGLAQELARIDARLDDLLSESDPRTAYEMLAAWEENAGLPDACWILLDDNSISARRMRLLLRMTGLGGQSPSYFVELAEKLGYANVSFEEYEPMSCVSACDVSLNTEDEGWPFVWKLKLPEISVSVMNCISACTDSLRSWGDEVLECIVRKFRPAHTTVFFAYGD